MKRLLQQGIKRVLSISGSVRPASPGGCTYLVYHSVRGRLPIELDLAPALLERQLLYLGQEGTVIDYASALSRLQYGSPPLDGSVVLTFDDGYLDFYTTVFPLLQQLNLPATLFVTTGFVDEGIPYPMLTYPHLGVEPVTWDMLGEMADSGLVTLGAHTHTHPVLSYAPLDRAEEELAKPLEIFQQRLGFKPAHFCYPRAEWDSAVETLVARYYQTAVVAGGERARVSDFNPYRIPRVPVRRSDGWRYFLAKVQGRMANEEKFYARLRRLRYSSSARNSARATGVDQ